MLTAGTYTTQVFETPLTYSVAEGWANYEDLPGNFLLVPPTTSIEDVDAGSGDYIGVAENAAPASANCFEVPQRGVDPTPKGMVEWYTNLDGVIATEPRKAQVSGLRGYVLDLRLADDWGGVCPYSQGVPMVPMLIGLPPTGLHHVIAAGTVTRLYLLRGHMDRTLVIELSDTPGGASMAELETAVATFQFATQ
jgi:hypothetical protein